MPFAAGIDVGGTFTDCVAIDAETGEMKWSKVPSTPPTFVEGVLDGLRASGVSPEKLTRLAVHATTIGINSIAERKYPPTALICTKGFRDGLEIRHSFRPGLYDPWWVKPATLIRRELRKEVTERINWKGEIVKPLDEDETREIVHFLRKRGIVSYAVATLFSFANPAHEQRIRSIILEEHPGAYVSLSSEVNPIIREYERTTTTTINAILMPTMSRYIADFRRALEDFGIRAPLLLMKSNGGMVPVGTAEARPVELLEGGHAAGTTLATHIGKMMGFQNLVTYDGGGTTATQSVVEHGEPVYDPYLDIEFDIPASTPSISIKSIGQGGGAIASIDKGGALVVGPASAGARPGPVCYGRGGTEPTITDALVLLGILDPEVDWICNTRWDVAATEKAVKTKIGDFFGWDTIEAAHSIYRVGVQNVGLLFREQVVARGRDPRDYVLFVLGGSGPMLAPMIARDQEISKIVIPGALGTASALGCLLSDMKYDYMHSYLAKTDEIDYGKTTEILEQMKRSALEDLARDNISEKPEFERYVDFRYCGEHFEVTVPLKGAGPLDRAMIEEGAAAFHGEHERLFGFARPEEPTEILTLRLRSTIRTSKQVPRRTPKRGSMREARIGVRDVYFDIKKGAEHSDVYDFDKAETGTISGPAIIHKRDGTIPVHPGDVCEIDEYGNCTITIGR